MGRLALGLNEIKASVRLEFKRVCVYFKEKNRDMTEFEPRTTDTSWYYYLKQFIVICRLQIKNLTYSF